MKSGKTLKDMKIITKFLILEMLEVLVELYNQKNGHAQDYVMARIGDKEYLMGEYSSMEKSYKAMEIMQKQFLDYCCNYHSQSGVFYFPKDNEVEV